MNMPSNSQAIIRSTFGVHTELVLQLEHRPRYQGYRSCLKPYLSTWTTHQKPILTGIGSGIAASSGGEGLA